MYTAAQLVLSLKDAQSEDERVVGQRVARIAHLRNGQFPVPNAFVVSPKAMQIFLETNNVSEFISRHLSTLNIMNQAHVDSVSREIGKRIQKAVYPEYLAVEIARQYNRLGSNQRVRIFISAPQNVVPQSYFFESMSQMVTTVGDANVLEEIKKMWATVYASTLLNYRNKFPHLKINPLVSICVQVLPEVEASGILMTQQDNTHQPYMLIESLMGYPQPIIDGSLSPDQYVYDRVSGEMLSAEIVPQSKQLVLHRNKFEYKNTNKKEQDIINISKKNIKKLGELGKKIHQYNFYPQYVVWISNKQGVQLLETFPLTESSVKAELKPNSSETVIKNLELILEGQPASNGIVSGPVSFWSPKTHQKDISKDSILVTEKITPLMFPLLKTVRGVIAQKGGITSHAAILAREIGLPCVVGATEVFNVLKKNQIITINGANGMVYKGSSSVRKINSGLTPITSTRTNIFQYEKQLVKEISETADNNLKGLVISAFDSILFTSKGNNKLFSSLLKNNPSEQVTDLLQKTYERFGQRPVWVQLSDLPLTENETTNQNNFAGYRGSLKLINEKNTLSKELEMIISAAERLESPINVLLPFVRYPSELHTLKKLINETKKEATQINLGLLIQVPAVAYNLEDYLSFDIKHLFVDLETLSQTLFSLNKTSYQAHMFADVNHPLIRKVIVSITQQLKNKATQLYVITPQNADQRLINDLVSLGIKNMIIESSDMQEVVATIKEAEQKNLSLIN